MRQQGSCCGAGKAAPRGARGAGARQELVTPRRLVALGLSSILVLPGLRVAGEDGSKGKRARRVRA